MVNKYIISYDAVIESWFNNILSKKIVDNGYKKLSILKNVILKIEDASDFRYPPIYIIPEARVLLMEGDVTAVIFANVTLKYINDKLSPVVELTLPSLLYGNNQEIFVAVLGHELLHYIYIAMKYYLNEYFINPLISTSTLDGREFLEEVYQIDPESIFKRGYVLRTVKKFEEVVRKHKLGYKIKRYWIERKLPTSIMSSSDFRLRLSIEDYSNMYIPDEVIERVRGLINDRV